MNYYCDNNLKYKPGQWVNLAYGPPVDKKLTQIPLSGDIFEALSIVSISSEVGALPVFILTLITDIPISAAS